MLGALAVVGMALCYARRRPARAAAPRAPCSRSSSRSARRRRGARRCSRSASRRRRIDMPGLEDDRLGASSSASRGTAFAYLLFFAIDRRRRRRVRVARHVPRAADRARLRRDLPRRALRRRRVRRARADPRRRRAREQEARCGSSAGSRSRSTVSNSSPRRRASPAHGRQSALISSARSLRRRLASSGPSSVVVLADERDVPLRRAGEMRVVVLRRDGLEPRHLVVDLLELVVHRRSVARRTAAAAEHAAASSTGTTVREIRIPRI